MSWTRPRRLWIGVFAVAYLPVILRLAADRDMSAFDFQLLFVLSCIQATMLIGLTLGWVRPTFDGVGQGLLFALAAPLLLTLGFIATLSKGSPATVLKTFGFLKLISQDIPGLAFFLLPFVYAVILMGARFRHTALTICGLFGPPLLLWITLTCITRDHHSPRRSHSGYHGPSNRR